jgi:salicylate hydroxylase
LHQRALQLGVVVELNARVVKYCEKSASVELANNSIIIGDLIVAADGKFGDPVYG